MNLLRILFFCAVLTGIGSTSCKKSKAACGTFGWALSIQDELNNLSAATNAYSQNDTSENCNAYKQAYSEYLDALQGIEHCLVTDFERDDWQQSLNEAQQEVDSIQC